MKDPPLSYSVKACNIKKWFKLHELRVGQVYVHQAS